MWKTQVASAAALLEQAGFRREPSAQAATGGAPRYEFHDPDFCRCVYVGGEREYAELQRVRAARVDQHYRELRAFNPSANSPGPMVWGAWNPQGLDLE